MPTLTRREFLKLCTVATGALAGQSFLSGCRPVLAPILTNLRPHRAMFSALDEASFRPGGLGTQPPGHIVDGQSDFWWAEKFTNQNLVSEMLSHTLRQLTGQSSDKTAWDALFTYYKTKRGQTGGYRPGEKIAIKANMNGSKSHSGLKNDSFLSPAVALPCSLSWSRRASSRTT